MNISVIVPFYGVEKYISRCVESLMCQTIKDNIEFIFVNDATKDQSLDILQKVLSEYPERKEQITILHHEKNKGLPAARNTGLVVAKGKYIYHCDSDDYLEKDALEILYKKAEKNNADIVWGDFYEVMPDGPRYKKQPAYFTPLDAIKGMLTGYMDYNVWNKLVRRDLYFENNILFPAGYAMGEDLTMIMLFSNALKVDFVTKPIYFNEVTPKDMEGSTVNLKFHNLVTVLDITVQGPQSGTATITNINVDAVEGSQPILTGDFKCNIRAAKTDGTVVCTPLGSFNEERGRISIPCYDKKTGHFIKLGPDELLNVKAYIIPQNIDNTVKKRTLRVTVSMLNGAPCRKTLNTADVTPHKINRVILPKLEVGGTNYWMSSLDRDIYVSELSLPGSKFAYATPDNGVTVRNFQDATITQQFTSGVRAFIVQTAGYAEYTRSGWGTVYTHNNSGKDDLYVTVNGNILQKDGKNVTIEDVLDELKACIDEAKKAKGESNNEYVVVQLTFEGNPCNSNYGNFNSERIWIEALQAKLNSLISENSYNLYTDEITANTTIRDLREHIVLKVNYNSTAMGSYIAQDATIPALFSKWQGKYGDVDLRWGTPNESSIRRPMHWLYQEATHVGSNTEITYQEKLDYIKKVFEDGVTRYQQNTEHDTWFMNDIGGRYIEDTDDAVTRLTTELNNYSVGLLQNRTANASLGLIFMNFADKLETSGALYKSDWLIQTIIDNNFKFALRKVPSSTTTTSYNASDKTRVNTVGWDK